MTGESSTLAPVAPSYNASLQQETTLEQQVGELCFGMLPDVVTLLKWTPNDTPNHTSQDTGKTGLSCWEPLSVGVQEDCAYLSTESGQAVCIINRRVSHAVVELHELNGLRLKAFAQAGEWRARLHERRTARTGRKDTANIRLKVVLIVIGPRVIADETARCLAQNHLFLQEPHQELIVGPYFNPQSLYIPEIPQDAACAGEVSRNGYNDETDRNVHESNDSLSSPGLVDLVLNIDEFYNHVPGHDYLQEAHIDGRIRTSLLAHQKVAVDFMLRRESGASQFCRSLWTIRTSDDGLPIFEHTITGAKCRTSQDCRGGLIADDAGLGKTLTTLATIANTLASSDCFMKHDESNVKATLVVVPSELLLTTWRDEITRHIYPGAINYEVYHGQGRQEIGARLSEVDLVLTTYGTVMVEYGKRDSILYRYNWYRLVLDEAHHIRNPASKQAKATNGLRACMRWCLTGTPIQNKLDDLGSILRFLKVPYLENHAIFNKHITSVIRQGSPEHGYDNLKRLLGSICLRRNRSIISGPGYCSEIIRPEFSQTERENYRSLEFRVRHAVITAEKSTTSKHAHHKIMEALLRLRMFCNTGLAAVPSAAGNGDSTFSLRPDEILAMLQQGGQAICFYCSADIESLGDMNAYDSGILTQCSNLVCSDCVSQYHEEFNGSPTPRCSICKFEHSIAELTSNANDVEADTQLKMPSKIGALLEDVQTHHLSKKCLIFSFWKKTLDMIGHALESRGLSYLRVDGSMPSKKRNTVLNQFQRDNSCRVLMMTFSTGGVGLNGLTVANRIYIMEPQWNPAVEQQAIGRVLRIDQDQPVTVVSYVMRRSIEEVVQSKQLRKLQLASGGFKAEEGDSQKEHSMLQQLVIALEAEL
ncbi:SNF2 family N-terminal domain-containing protein [Apiospora sp. TS-2023a]